MWLPLNYYNLLMMMGPKPTNVTFFQDFAEQATGSSIVYEFSESRIAAANALADHRFPSDFLFGVGMSAPQTEGAWNLSDRTPSIWDDFVHMHPDRITDGSNADVAADFYHHYPEDIVLADQLNAKSMRISMSWSRILPDGYSSRISQSGIAFYNGLINEMLKRGIEPMVVIYHWDLPRVFQSMGGWTNPQIVDWFVEYADTVFHLFGDRVKLWATLYEPQQFCVYGYSGQIAPNVNSSGVGDYVCLHHMLLAHGKAYKLYDTRYRSRYNGKVGILPSMSWFVPDRPTLREEVAGTERFFEFWNGWVMNPIFSIDGDYPAVMKMRIDENSIAQGFSKSRLPLFSTQEIEMLKGSADFLGINFISATAVRLKSYDPSALSFYDDMGMQLWPPPMTPFDIRSTPWALQLLGNKLNQKYRLPFVYVTEGAYFDKGTLNDVGRAKYNHQHLITSMKLMRTGVDIRGFYSFSLLDGFDWTRGYSVRTGLYHVDFNDPNRKRTPKMSTKIVSSVFKQFYMPHLSQLFSEFEVGF